jgi:very-short-patch-repair endonuclease
LRDLVLRHQIPQTERQVLKLSQGLEMILPMHWEDRLRELAGTQEGLVARLHLAQHGLMSEHWRRLKHSGRWDILSCRVIRSRGAPESDTQRALAAVLDASPGAALHGPTALAWFGMPGYSLAHLRLMRPFNLSSTRPKLGTLHQLRDLRPHDVVVVRGVPTETALRAIWVEAARYARPALADIGYERIGRLLDQAHRKGLVTWAALHEMVEDIHERGRSGTVIMRALADERPPGSSPTESRNEDQFEKLLANAGVPPLRRQVVVGGHEAIGRADFRDATLPLAVEINSLSFHTTPSDREADKDRYRRLNDAGFTVAVIWDDDLWTRTSAVLRTVADARQRARRRDRVVLHSPGCPWPG